MDRTALVAALAAGLLAPPGEMDDDKDIADRGVICGEPAPANAGPESSAPNGLGRGAVASYLPA